MKKKYFSGQSEIVNLTPTEVYDVDEEALFKNSSPRCPVVLLVDTSGSMKGEKINEVNDGVKKFIEYINEDYQCKKRVELALISFNYDTKIVSDFSPADTKQFIPFQASGGTIMAPALQLALDMIEKRKKEYKDSGRSYYRPLVFFLTDGGPGDERETIQMKEKILELSNKKHLVFFAIKIGEERTDSQEKRHTQILQGFDAKVPAGRLDVDKIGEFFIWLSSSVSQISSSTDTDKLQLADPNAWWKNLTS